MTKLSAVIIAHNEEKNIGRCIDSLKDVADEILVYDNGSEDNTKAICIDKGIHYVEGEWLGYAQTKNKANALAQYDYILSLDADEALSESLQNAILKEKEKGFSGVYQMNRLNNYCGVWVKYGGWYPDKKIRIFPKHIRWVGDFVHESLDYHSLKIKQLSGDLLHYSYYTKEEHIKREKKYARLAYHRSLAKGKQYHPLQNILSAIFCFIKMYLIKGGFIMGKTGWDIAIISSKAKLWRK
jgi:(heptosyl)LPS beta-1,4-glucosyltransferase